MGGQCWEHSPIPRDSSDEQRLDSSASSIDLFLLHFNSKLVFVFPLAFYNQFKNKTRPRTKPFSLMYDYGLLFLFGSKL